jgi:hypothetical protein
MTDRIGIDEQIAYFECAMEDAVATTIPFGPHLVAILATLRDYKKIMEAKVPEPVAMLLFCPHCGEQHVDAPDEDKGWANPPHRSHECQFCGWVWRPADVATTGVLKIETQGKVDKSARPRYFATAADFEKATTPPSGQCEGMLRAAVIAENLVSGHSLEIGEAIRAEAEKLPHVPNECKHPTDCTSPTQCEGEGYCIIAGKKPLRAAQEGK